MALNQAEFLIDNSALNRIQIPEFEKVLRPLLEKGLLATCGALEVEALYSAKNQDDYDRLVRQRGAILQYIDTSENDWQTALRIQRELTKKAQHRGPRVPDLIISAVAINNDLTLLHYDSDFDRIREIFGGKIEWVVPKGTV